MELSIILPCADDDGLESCLASIDEDVEVVAVLNGAAPRLRDIARASGLVTIELPERNLGAACQAGCLAASNDLVLLMNTDATFAPGAIADMVADWRSDSVVRATLRFDGRGAQRRWVENLQNHQMSYPDRAYQPGLLIHREIRERVGGYFFDTDIHWTEDADLDRRLRGAGISVVVSRAVVTHGRVTIWRKFRSAFRYGIGRGIAEYKQLYGTTPHYRLSLSAWRAEYATLTRRYGRGTAAYGLAWNVCFGAGVYAQRYFDVQRVRTRIRHAGRPVSTWEVP